MPKFAEDIADVCAYCPLANDQCFRNLVIGLAVGDQFQHFDFADG